MRFLGLGINDPVPKAKTIWLLRDKLSKEEMVEKLFSHLDSQLDHDGIIVHRGKFVDASIVEVPVQRNSRDEKKRLKENNIPEYWSENKLRQKDTAAQWITHNGKNYSRYPNYIKADSATKHITGYKATTANTNDSEVKDELLDKKKMAASYCMPTALTESGYGTNVPGKEDKKHHPGKRGIGETR